MLEMVRDRFLDLKSICLSLALMLTQLVELVFRLVEFCAKLVDLRPVEGLY